ncbi:hypothetical protein O6B96_01580 [Campylobacter ureolyticus]|uniref:hypothetical protein n=1 Tax=Campylobacter ureolyticus TaxID=827 RepID=UPI0022B2F41B|nr:hypothetical protein [Campylobacter ureolyticus]MCZ6149746.1 hypothetical protein [Campylobacter ureolyticus]
MLTYIILGILIIITLVIIFTDHFIWITPLLFFCSLFYGALSYKYTLWEVFIAFWVYWGVVGTLVIIRLIYKIIKLEDELQKIKRRYQISVVSNIAKSIFKFVFLGGSD